MTVSDPGETIRNQYRRLDLFQWSSGRRMDDRMKRDKNKWYCRLGGDFHGFSFGFAWNLRWLSLVNFSSGRSDYFDWVPSRQGMTGVSCFGTTAHFLLLPACHCINLQPRLWIMPFHWLLPVSFNTPVLHMWEFHSSQDMFLLLKWKTTFAWNTKDLIWRNWKEQHGLVLRPVPFWKKITLDGMGSFWIWDADVFSEDWGEFWSCGWVGWAG